MNKKVILECDPGIDDALAIILAIKGGLDLQGIIAGHGNSSSQNSVLNAKRVLKLLGREDIPVIVGQHLPVRPKDKIEAGNVHGNDGLGNTNLPYSPQIEERTPRELIEDTSKNEKLTMVITGPSTSLYYSLREKPSLLERLDELVIMGCVVNESGNISKVSEFNFYADPVAADFCLQLPIEKTLVGLDVTRKALLTPKLLEELSRKNTDITRFIEKIVQHYFNFYMGELGFGGCPMHDPLTVGYLLKPEYFTREEVNARVETDGIHTKGELILEKRLGQQKEPNAYVCTGINSKEFLAYFLETIS